MKLNVEPRVALCDKKLSIFVSEVPPQSKVRIGARMCLPWAKDVMYESAAAFTADSSGMVDLSKQKPDKGSYDSPDSMGLLVSMKSSEPKALQKIGRNISIQDDLAIDLFAECEGKQDSVTLKRLFKNPEILSHRISDGFIGEFFYADDPDRPSVAWIGGSGSNLAINALVAAPLASHGFNVLSLPFFGDPGLPTQLSRIPLEYFEKAFDWLRNHPVAGKKEIGLVGMSKGAEAALILAFCHPYITKVALWAPHAYCFQGIAFKNESYWTFKEKDLPYIRLENVWVYSNMLRGFVTNRPFEFASVYRKGLATAQKKESARIRVEDANADLLLLTTKQCGMWNTYDGCAEIMNTLEKCRYPHAFDLIVYEDAGEPFLVPYVFPVVEDSLKMAPRLTLSLGGTMQGNCHAWTDSWERTIEFFKNWH
jgi:hypothetical protein